MHMLACKFLQNLQVEDHFHWYLQQHFGSFYVITILASKNLHGLILSNSLLGSWAEVAAPPLLCGKMWHSVCNKPLCKCSTKHRDSGYWWKNTAREALFNKKVFAGLHLVVLTGPYLGRGLPGRLWIWPSVLELGGAGYTLTECLHGTNRHRATSIGVCLGHMYAQACGHMCRNRRACTFTQICTKFPDRSVCIYVCYNIKVSDISFIQLMQMLLLLIRLMWGNRKSLRMI